MTLTVHYSVLSMRHIQYITLALSTCRPLSRPLSTIDLKASASLYVAPYVLLSCLLIWIQHFHFAQTQNAKVLAAAIIAASGAIAIYIGSVPRFLKSWVMERNMSALIARRKSSRQQTLVPQWLHIILGLGFLPKPHCHQQELILPPNRVVGL